MRQYDFLSTGAGKDLFGPEQPTAVKAAKEALSTIENVASRHMTKEEIQKVRQRVQEYAAKFPLEGTFRTTEPVPLRLNQSLLSGVLGVVGLPLAPLFTAQKINEGVSNIKEWGPTIDRLTDVIQDLPRNTRWQAEQFMLFLDKNESMQSALASASRISQSTDRLTVLVQDMQPLLQQYARILDMLPSDMGGQARLILTDVDRNRTVQVTTESLDRISKTSDKLVAVVQDLPASIQQVIDRSSQTATGRGTDLVDHIFWRAAELLILAFILAAILVALSRACRPKGPSKPPAAPGPHE